MSGITRKSVEKAAATMLRACKEFSAKQMNLVLRGEDKKPIAGVFCVAEGKLAGMVENLINEYEKVEDAPQDIVEEKQAST
jgi:hypothetical protein